MDIMMMMMMMMLMPYSCTRWFMHMHFHAPPRHPSSRLSFKAFPTSGFLERGTPGRKSLSGSLNAGSALVSRPPGGE